MGLFRRRPPPEPSPLVVPRLAGDGGWPPMTGRSFEASTHHELGTRRAFDADAHGIGEALLEAALPHLDLRVEADDEPYLRSVLSAAARTGAGIGLVEVDLSSPSPALLSPAAAGALWQARGGLPSMREEWGRIAAWCLLAGHYAARVGPSALVPLVAALRSEKDH